MIEIPPTTIDKDVAAYAVRAGTADDYIRLTQTSELLTCIIRGAPRGEDIVEVFVEGLASGKLRTTSRTLVDMREFTGSIDWGAIREISGLADWGSDPKGYPPVAFISDNLLFQMVAKIANAFFPRSFFKVFNDPEAALHWVTHYKLTPPEPQTKGELAGRSDP